MRRYFVVLPLAGRAVLKICAVGEQPAAAVDAPPGHGFAITSLWHEVVDPCGKFPPDAFGDSHTSTPDEITRPPLHKVNHQGGIRKVFTCVIKSQVRRIVVQIGPRADDENFARDEQKIISLNDCQ